MTMIWAAFTSEWTKLKRKTLFLSTFLGLAAAASLFVVLRSAFRGSWLAPRLLRHQG